MPSICINFRDRLKVGLWLQFIPSLSCCLYLHVVQGCPTQCSSTACACCCYLDLRKAYTGSEGVGGRVNKEEKWLHDDYEGNRGMDIVWE